MSAVIPEFMRSRAGADLGLRAAAASGAVRETLADLRSRIEQERAELNSLRGRIDSARSRLQGLLDQIRSLESERDRLRALVNDLTGRISDLTSRGADYVPEPLKRYYDQIASLESQIASAWARISNLRAEIESLRRQEITIPPTIPSLPEEIAPRIWDLEQRGRELFDSYVRSPSRVGASALEGELSRISQELVSLRQEYAMAVAPPPVAPPAPTIIPPELAATISRIGQLEQTIQRLFYEMLRQRDSTSMRELQDAITRLQMELEAERRRRAELEAALRAPPPAPPPVPAPPPAPPILAILARRPILGALVSRWLPGYVAPPTR